MSPFAAPHSITALIAYALWAVALVLALAIARTTMVLRGRAKANSFTAGVPHGSDAYWRLNRAHLNAVENLPIFAALVLTARLAHIEVLLPAEIILIARVVQSLIHISSGRNLAVNFRFAAFATQVTCYGVMIVKLLSAPAS